MTLKLDQRRSRALGATFLIIIAAAVFLWLVRPRQQVLTFDGGAVTVTVPAGSLPDGLRPKDIRVERLERASVRAPEGLTGLGGFSGYRLLPEGSAFKRPVSVTVRYPAAAAEVPLVVHASGDEVDIPDGVAYSYDAEKREVALTVPVAHFSELLRSEAALFRTAVDPVAGDYPVGGKIPFSFTIEMAAPGPVAFMPQKGEAAEPQGSTLTLKPGYHVSGKNGAYTFMSMDDKIEPAFTHVSEREVAPGASYVLTQDLRCVTVTEKPSRYVMGTMGIPVSFVVERRTADGRTETLQRAVSVTHKGAAYNCLAADAKQKEEVYVQPDGSAQYGGKKYYVVRSTDPTGDTGNEVCAKVGKTCAGYTALTQGVCLAMHPGAQPSEDFNGSNAGFYCDGPPQGGICAQERNTCHICPACNLNMDCDMEIGVLYRETYVECK